MLILDSLKLYWKNLWILTRPLLPSVAYITAGLYLFALLYSLLMTSVSPFYAIVQGMPFALQVLITLIIGAIGIVPIYKGFADYILYCVSTNISVSQLIDGKPLEAESDFQTLIKHAGKLVGAFFTASLCIGLVGTLILYAGFWILGSGGIAWVFLLLGSVVWIVGALLQTLAFQILAFEPEQRTVAAILKRGAQLVLKDFWFCVGCQLANLLIPMIATQIFITVLDVLQIPNLLVQLPCFSPIAKVIDFTVDGFAWLPDIFKMMLSGSSFLSTAIEQLAIMLMLPLGSLIFTFFYRHTLLPKPGSTLPVEIQPPD